MYHGWSDQAISPLASIQYYNDVVHVEGGNLPGTRKFARLFLVPGMHHCGDGPGPNVFDTLTALDTWVSSGVAPDGIIASHFTDNDLTMPVDRTMPLCAYPEVAAYVGGNADEASSWRCENQR
jgi:feruloyl esterase